MDNFVKPRISQNHSVFAIRGDLDGAAISHDFSESRQYIGLVIGGDEFLLPIEVMNEIIMINQLTFVPGAPRFIEGVINLRGKILPTINLRQMMGLENIIPGPQSRIIIAHHEDIQIGVLVDAISYVVTLFPNQIQNQTVLNKGTGTELISGLSKRGEQVHGILDISRIIAETGALGPKLSHDPS
jgi:purine-binding chemotaxis protein CheW